MINRYLEKIAVHIIGWSQAGDNIAEDWLSRNGKEVFTTKNRQKTVSGYSKSIKEGVKTSRIKGRYLVEDDIYGGRDIIGRKGPIIHHFSFQPKDLKPGMEEIHKKRLDAHLDGILDYVKNDPHKTGHELDAAREFGRKAFKDSLEDYRKVQGRIRNVKIGVGVGAATLASVALHKYLNKDQNNA